MGTHRRVAEDTYLDLAEVQIEELAYHTATKDDVKRAERRSDRNRTVAICVVALLCVASICINLINNERLNSQVAATAINTGAIQALQQAREELRAAGVPEDQLPPPVSLDPTQPVDVDALVEAASATVLAKIRTDPNYRGVIGATGPTGATGAPGETGPAGQTPGCLLSPTGCQGPAGQPGLNGTAGEAGEDGQDGLQGPIGPQGPQGEEGPQGPQGEQGPPGEQGPAGVDGKCPDGSDMQQFTVSDGLLGTVSFLACPVSGG